MKNLIVLLFIFCISSCKKESDSRQNTIKKDYIFDYNKEKIDDLEKTELFVGKDQYEFDKYLNPISKEEYLKDSLDYKNSLDSKQSIFKNNVLQTAYGDVKFVPSESKDSDTFVNYSYLGFSEVIASHIINLNLYEGEKTLLLSNQDYQYVTISSTPFFSKSKNYALNFKDIDGLSSQVSVFDIKNKKLIHFTTLWSENYLTDNVFWDGNDNIIFKIRKNNSGAILYAKILISDIKSGKKTTESSVKKNKIQDWKGEYKITTKAISNYNQKEIDLLYSISVTSNESAILSIGADQTQDYWCEGDYYLIEENGVLKATGKCDENDINDFYLRQENGVYYIKSKRFLNQDWQVLKKE
ncbi:hypothetical protein [Epilithonimonas sp.]|uniref:hypothetical protein n=1 Tax=Epilithonimonas sp. TaxID=2894511 RepID=UPI002FDDDCB1